MDFDTGRSGKGFCAGGDGVIGLYGSESRVDGMG